MRDRTWPRWLASIDRIGIDAWFAAPLQDGASPPQITAGLDALWGAPMGELRAAFPDKPIVFAESGIRGQPGTFSAPWTWNAGGADDDGIQRRWYRGLCDWGKRVGVAGITWWQIGLDLPRPGLVLSGFNPLGRPAESEVRRCFAPSAPSPAA